MARRATSCIAQAELDAISEAVYEALSMATALGPVGELRELVEAGDLVVAPAYRSALLGTLAARMMMLREFVVDAGALRLLGIPVPPDVPDHAQVQQIGTDESGARVQLFVSFIAADLELS